MKEHPRRIRHYHVLGVIAEGGMGVVFQAVHMAHNRHGTLKVLRHRAISQSDARARFRTEAEAVARLRHPNFDKHRLVARLTDFGLARLTDREGGITVSLCALGTPA